MTAADFGGVKDRVRITERMIEAGITALRERVEFAPSKEEQQFMRDIVMSVYRAMEAERRTR